MTRDAVMEGAVRELLSHAHDGVLPIVTVGDPVLRTAAAALTDQLEPRTLEHLVEVMRATMHDAPGVGLAAPQIGVPLRIAVIEDMYPVSEEVATQRERTPFPFRVIVNPRYDDVGSARRSFYEGCLSMPGYQAVVPRAASVRLRCTDLHGAVVDEEFGGWPARIVAHETDHLDGTVYIDRAVTRSLSANDVYADLWADPTPEHAAAALGFDLGTGRGDAS
ncbi:peptide deformylase [Rhodococcus sp. RS1C4]|nr:MULTISPECIES: peptide deformylase [unclassified Rhodococcus (in: high G+C Gram-positive bacteria)]OZC47703.1 peptide deformylase [Rhodococcus sp. RS1C4]OZC81030.1 peptide deformylase [Rhodococcus sp. 06-418-1B]